MTAVAVVILVAMATIATLATGAAIYLRRLQAAHVAVVEALRPLADGDLTAKISIPAGRRGAELADLLAAIVDRLSRVFTQVELTQSMLSTGWRDVDEMAWKSLDNTETTAARIASAARSAEGISEHLHVIATATEELAATVQEIARHASEASGVASTAAAEVGAANETVGTLTSASRHIEEVLHLISTIATQTHMLSLNATIEAARAGAAGSGFAVVAGEVKKLSQQTGAATESVEASIASIHDGVVEAAEAMGRVTTTIARVNDNQQGIAVAVDQQSLTTRDIGANATEAALSAAGLADDVSALVASIRLAAYAGAHARTVAAELAELDSGLATVLNLYTFNRVEAEVRAVESAGVQRIGNVTTIPHYVTGSGVNEIEYTENWRQSKANLESDSGDAYCGMPGDVATVRFVGTRIRYYGAPEATRGMVAISIDGGPETIVDQYGVSRDKMMFWQSDVLPAGQHTMRARVTGEQNPASRYIWVTLECLEIDD
jgi:methyl-accepting chemotaxis protein